MALITSIVSKETTSSPNATPVCLMAKTELFIIENLSLWFFCSQGQAITLFADTGLTREIRSLHTSSLYVRRERMGGSEV